MSFRFPLPAKRMRPDEIGPLARLLREERGLTLQQVAGDLRISVSGLSQAERNAAGGERVALRAIHHLKKLSGRDSEGPGFVQREVWAYGSAVEDLTRLRAPETARRAALLKQALLARGIEPVPTAKRTEVLRFQVGAFRIRVRLEDMMVLFSKTKRDSRSSPLSSVPLGHVVDPSLPSVEDDLDQWVQSIDVFARALVEPADEEEIKQRLRQVLRPITQGASDLSPGWAER